MYWGMGELLPGAGWLLMSSMMFQSVHFSSQSKFHWTAAQPSGVLFTSSYFVLCSLLRVCSAPEARSLMKMMNRTGHRFGLWDTPLATKSGRLCATNHSTMSLLFKSVLNPPHSLLRILLLTEALAWTKVQIGPYGFYLTINWFYLTIKWEAEGERDQVRRKWERAEDIHHPWIQKCPFGPS